MTGLGARCVQNDRVEGGAPFRMTGLRASPAFASLRVPLRCAKGTFAQPTSFRRKPAARGTERPSRGAVGDAVHSRPLCPSDISPAERGKPGRPAPGDHEGSPLRVLVPPHPDAPPPRAYPCVRFGPRPLSLSERGRCPLSIAAFESPSQMFMRNLSIFLFSTIFVIVLVIQ